MASFGNRLKELRKEKHLNQTELAQKIGVNQSTISQLEKGFRNPTPAIIKKLAIALDINREELVGKDDKNFEKDILMRNLKGMSPKEIRKINELIEMLKSKDNRED